MAEQRPDRLSLEYFLKHFNNLSRYTSEAGLNSRRLEFGKWLAALKTYLRVTQATSLELKPKRVGKNEALGIYKVLPNSQVIDLNISCDKDLKGEIECLLQLVVTSKIKRLSICWCMLSKKELLRLMEALKNTLVTELSIHYNSCKNHLSHEGSCPPEFNFDRDEKEEFISHLLASRLTRFDFPLRSVIDESSPLLCVAQNTSVTNLNLSHTTFSTGVLSKLFSSLRHTAVTDLILSYTEISEDDLKQLSLNLRNSNVVNLNLAGNRMDDARLDILTEGLAHSKIKSLDISGIFITGSNSFGLCLKDTQISDLNLSVNSIASRKLMSFPDFLRHSSIVRLKMKRCVLSDPLGRELIKCLKFSKVTHLNLAMNRLQLSSLVELASILNDTSLVSVDISTNVLSPEGVKKLGDGLKSSLLKVIRLNNEVFEGNNGLEPSTVASFLEKTKGTSLETVDLALKCPKLQTEGVNTIAASLVGTTFTHLNLNCNDIKDGIISLAPQLKFTAITRLDLRNNKVGDAGVKTLANCLMNTKIMYLNLTDNDVTDCGAKFLAASLKSTNLLQLQLTWNKIDDEGLEILAKHAEGTFMTVLDVTCNLANWDLLIDRILLENQTSVYRFVSLFKQIAPEPNENRFHFGRNINDKNIDTYLEECLLFYKTIMEQTSAVSVLVAEDSVHFSREQITHLKKEFPRQFTTFITNEIEASPTQHVSFLRRAEELNLAEIVEFLLLSRPALMINQKEEILDPYVYQLLHKYNQPLYNSSIEPEGKTKIIKYFTEHSDLDGACDVINILESKRKKEN